MALTLDYLSYMENVFGQYAWTSEAMASVHSGPIPPVINFPAMGIMPTGGAIDASDDTTETVEITVIKPVNLRDSAKTFEELIAIRNEIYVIMLSYPDWFGSVDFSWVTGWTTDVLETEDKMNRLQAITVTIQVRYRTPVS
jgi:hypothetical protein